MKQSQSTAFIRREATVVKNKSMQSVTHTHKLYVYDIAIIEVKKNQQKYEKKNISSRSELPHNNTKR